MLNANSRKTHSSGVRLLAFLGFYSMYMHKYWIQRTTLLNVRKKKPLCEHGLDWDVHATQAFPCDTGLPSYYYILFSFFGIDNMRLANFHLLQCRQITMDSGQLRWSPKCVAWRKIMFWYRWHVVIMGTVMRCFFLLAFSVFFVDCSKYPLYPRTTLYGWSL